MAEENEGAEREQRERTEGEDLTAPSVGPNTVIEKDPPEERLARHEQSDTDALGLDKRREVIGGRYGPSLGRQVAMYGIALAVTAVVVIGAIFLVREFDQPPDSYPDKAPWTGSSKPPAKLQ